MIFNNLQPTRPPRLLSGMSGAATYPPATTTVGHVGRSNLQPKRGFTIMEMLVVVGIIGIVTGIIMSSISSAKAKGRDAKRIADISVIQLALERYYDINRNYPTSLSVFLTDSSVPTKDPSGNDYKYSALNADNTAVCSSGSCQSYHLGATLELYNAILADDADDIDLKLTPITSPDFDGTDNTTSLFVYDVVPKF